MNTDTTIHIMFNGKPITVTWDGKPPVDGWINVVGHGTESRQLTAGLTSSEVKAKATAFTTI